MTSPEDLSGWRFLPRQLPEPNAPLWRRTQLRLQRMETWSAQHRNTSDGFCERIQLQDQRIALASRHLVLLLKDWEERRTSCPAPVAATSRTHI